MNIKFSIIIPHRNTPVLLRRCLDSIPVREDVQIIVVDDNSDNCIIDDEIRQDTKHPKVELISIKENKGAGYSRNIGISCAKGEWILFADADDYYETDNLDNLFNLRIPDNIDVLLYGYNNVINDIVEPVNCKQTILTDSSGYDTDVTVRDLYSGKNCTPWNKMVRRDFIIKHGISFEEVKVGNDLFFSVQLAVSNPSISILRVPIYNYVKRDDSLMNTQSLANYITRVNVILRSNLLLKRSNLKLIPCNIFLTEIRNYSYFKFLYYSLKELVTTQPS